MPSVRRPLNQLELWSDYDCKYPSGAALVVTKKKTLGQSLRRSFPHLKELGTVEAVDGERKVGRYYLFLAQRVESR